MGLGYNGICSFSYLLSTSQVDNSKTKKGKNQCKKTVHIHFWLLKGIKVLAFSTLTDFHTVGTHINMCMLEYYVARLGHGAFPCQILAEAVLKFVVISVIIIA